MVQDYNGISNPSKHQETVLGNRFSFPTIDFLELLGMTIHQDLNFDKHYYSIFKKVNDQFKLLSKHTMLLLHRNFIVSRFSYCAAV